MKKSILFAALVTAALSAPLAFADDAHHPEQPKKAAPAKSGQTADTENKKTGMQMDRMQEQMKKMQAQMEEIRKTTDPEERQKLMQKHMQSMREGMKTMRGMCDDMDEGGGMMGGDMKSGMMGGDMMEKHMEMMQMMMNQMMEHQGQQDSMPMKK
jgi:periplasmic protein CpxP/Spy